MKHTLTFNGRDVTFEASGQLWRQLRGSSTTSGEDRCLLATREAVKNIFNTNNLIVEVKSDPEIMPMKLGDALEMVHEAVDPVAPLRLMFSTKRQEQ